MDAVQELPSEDRLLTVTSRVANGAGEILVDDSGPGIPESIRDRLFDSFFTTKQDGLGMGLSICRSIVESLSGHITVENREDGGARFRISFPLAKPAKTSDSRPAAIAQV